MNASPSTEELPLFPLQAVLFPDGLLGLKVFEARYLDLIGRCLREGKPFGVVGLKRGQEVRLPGHPAEVELEEVGTRAELIDVDSPQPGILSVRCRGGIRFRVVSSRQQEDGLWVAQTTPIARDAVVSPPPELAGAVRGLADAITALRGTGPLPFLAPHRFDDASWVANRWCEILPIPLAARQRLLELGDPLTRLQIVDEYLRSKGLVT